MSIQLVNDLALDLLARDFSNGRTPTNGGPTRSSRALAIIHLAAHDAYAKVTGKFAPRLATLPNPVGIKSDEATGTIALLSAGIRAAVQLYPDDAAFITMNTTRLIANADPRVLLYGQQVADAWINERRNDGSASPQTDKLYASGPGRHRPDPLDPDQPTLGRAWGNVKPFVLKDVASEAFLPEPPKLESEEYATAFSEVINLGKDDIDLRQPDLAAIGVFWGYDGANLLGTPPRLYNQVVREIPEFKNAFHPDQVRILTAINVAMADAAIAAWYWKYAYDFWRPVVGIREADKGFGPTGIGDKNPKTKGDPFWLPLGAPRSNPFPEPRFGAKGNNVTPNFPAYPSGHATFGAACFETAASLLKKRPEELTVKFVSDEFNGKTTDNTGTVRPRWEQTFTLRKAIEQNNISRIYLGVHWKFDATGGESVGKQVADRVSAAFR
jgi:membrane-associated phospholipid phosphatase